MRDDPIKQAEKRNGAHVATAVDRAEEAMAKRAQVRFGVIGYGYWGPQLVRNLDRLAMGEVVYVADLSPERRQMARMEFPSVDVTDDVQTVLQSDVDAVIVATPIRTHYKLARAALEAGKHVFVEKPLAATVAEAEELYALSEQVGRVLMVGHTFVYNPAVDKLRQIMQSGELGQLYYIDAIRVNLGLFQRDINVMWDLAPHDLSILDYLLDMRPQSVSAHGSAFIRQGIHDVVYMTLRYPSGLLAHIHLSWLNPSKVRRFTVVGEDKMVVYDDVEATEKVRIYNRGVDAPGHTSTFGEFQLSYRYGEIVSPHIQWSEPLSLECRHFAQAITEGIPSRSGGREGLRVVRVLEAADRSLADNGGFVKIPWGEVDA
ncbi:MAG TPA: Gfo/Idh/MocA family oxidoreductase [Ktedonobacterales bacterium]|nr:Gfo/Idh/MocA family oxidoreductase [Ktedonobacterales bacterium]